MEIAEQTTSQLLQGLLDQRGWSAQRLVARTGILPSTLSRWLSGRTEPRPEALKLALDALGADPGVYEAALSGIETPHALRALRGTCPLGDASASVLMPGTGDLIRAMRERRGLSVRCVALSLDLSASTVTRWEQSGLTVPPEHREKLCDLLGAYAEEREWLCAGHVFLPGALAEGADTVDAWEARLRAVQAECDAWTSGPHDLLLLSVLAGLCQRVRRSESFLDLLVEALVIRAVYLTDRCRAPSAIRCGRAAWRLATGAHWPRSRLDRPNWSYAHALAGCGEHDQAILVRTEVAAQQESPRDLALECLDIGRYLLESDDYEAAESMLARAERAYRRLDDDGGVANARWLRGSALVSTGRAAEAMLVLPEPTDDSPTFGFHYHMGWADAYREVGDPTSAHAHIDACERLMEERPALTCHRDTVDLARRLLG